MEQMHVILPLVAMFLFACLVAGGATFAGRFLGPRKLEGPKILTYECGMDPVGDAQHRKISVKYYLVAILFLLFDLEAAFLLPVALAWPELKSVGVISLYLIGFFLFFFVLSIFYEFKVKALEWEGSLS